MDNAHDRPALIAARRGILLEAQARALEDGIWYAEDFHQALAQQRRGLTGWVLVPGRMPGDAWQRTGRYAFILKSNRSASDAIDDVLRGPTLTECSIWTLAVQYASVRDVLGKVVFDTLFGSASAAIPIRQRAQLTLSSLNPLDYFFTRYDKAPIDTLMPGDHLYYGGVPGYLIKHPIGVAQGWNVLCTGHNVQGEPLYIGLGLRQPIKQRALRAYLVDAYNTPRHSIEKWIARLRPRKFALESRQLTETVEDVDGATRGFSWMRRFRTESFTAMQEGPEAFAVFCAQRTR